MLSKDELTDFNGDKLRKIRENRGFTMKELAHRAGISEPALWKLENGSCLPSAITLSRIARALLKEPDDFLGPDEDMLQELQYYTRVFEAVNKMGF